MGRAIGNSRKRETGVARRVSRGRPWRRRRGTSGRTSSPSGRCSHGSRRGRHRLRGCRRVGVRRGRSCRPARPHRAGDAAPITTSRSSGTGSSSPEPMVDARSRIRSAAGPGESPIVAATSRSTPIIWLCSSARHWSYTGRSWRTPCRIDCIICAVACALGFTRLGTMSVLMLTITPSSSWSMLGDVFMRVPPGTGGGGAGWASCPVLPGSCRGGRTRNSHRRGDA